MSAQIDDRLRLIMGLTNTHPKLTHELVCHGAANLATWADLVLASGGHLLTAVDGIK